VQGLRDRLGQQFAGVAFEAGTGRFIVPVAGDGSDVARAELEARNLGGLADVYRVQRSFEELEVAEEAIYRHLKAFFDAGEIAQSVDVASNSVLLSASTDLSASDLQAIRKDVLAEPVPVAIKAVPPSAVKGTTASCGTMTTGPDCDRPLRGGVRIWNPTTVQTCSAGARADRGASHFVVTAGHCNATLGGTWFARHFTTGTDYAIGVRYDQRFNFEGDISLITLSASSFWLSGSQVPESVIWNYNNDWQHNGKAWSYLNEQVCWTGATSTGCGNVDALATSTNYSGVYVGALTHVASSFGCAAPGTSGGSVEDGHYILGVVSGRNDDCSGMWYNEVLRAEQLWGVSIATTP
jgi:hypothetical protein